MKKMLLPVLVAAVVLGGVGAVYAQESTTTPTIQFEHSEVNPMNNLVKKIAEKFNLDENEVQKVFDEEHAARETVMKAKMEERLNQAVADGKITDAQKKAILQKLEELKNNREEEMESLKNMTDEERRNAMEKKREELKKWAKDNGIDEQYLMFTHKVGHGKFMIKSN